MLFFQSLFLNFRLIILCYVTYYVTTIIYLFIVQKIKETENKIKIKIKIKTKKIDKNKIK